MKIAWFFLLLIEVLTCYVYCDEFYHEYKVDEKVFVWVQNLEPDDQDPRKNLTWPFCIEQKRDESHFNLKFMKGLQGLNVMLTDIKLEFRKNLPDETNFITQDLFCRFVPKIEEEPALKDWIDSENKRKYMLYIDDVAFTDEIGFKEGSEYKIYKKKIFNISWNGTHILDVSLTNVKDDAESISTEVSITYEVKWTEVPEVPGSRFTMNFWCWYPIIIIFSVVVLLAGIVFFFLVRSLRKDFALCIEDDKSDSNRILGGECGWKQIQGDVFQPPVNSLLFSSLIGAGLQVLAAIIGVVVFILIGRKELLPTIMFVYAATSSVNGFFGGANFSKRGGEGWIRQMLLSAILLPFLICIVVYTINWVQLYQDDKKFIPFESLLAVTCVCLFIILPLTLVGTVLGRNLAGAPDFPCHVNTAPRKIPDKECWFMEQALIVILGGVIPFASMFIEIYFIFSSFWTLHMAYLYGFSLLAFAVLVITIVCVSVVSTYIYLSQQDYRWQWTSFFSAASTSVYVFIYLTCYYFSKTQFHEVFFTAYYFGCVTLFTLAFGIMSGAIGYTGSSIFVRKIYTHIKTNIESQKLNSKSGLN